MKFLLLPLLSILLLTLSCSGNDTEQEPTTLSQTKHFNPPAWIKGKWIFRDSPTGQDFKFTNDDFITENKSFNDMINQSKDKTNVIAIENEYSSNENYKFKITTRSKTSNYYDEQTYSFFKKNDTLMMRVPDMLGLLYYVKVKE
ncbi:hypothetical protein [Chryseobacterium sediminis]|uniref:Lipocalin family protein n=1 Tax=Chryseobacterium sediminis TaxID=1679494 RepID=A0A5B2UDW1_9FLAO|nr:hypothetical protein [Chryseobacterium sediminis]KAA2224746.1 hypothetical protein FW780_11275 [Chryseobacterium sediminis]